MAITLQQLIEAYCAELLKAHSTFLVMQRSAYIDMLGDEFNRLVLDDNHFLGIDEVSFSMYLRLRPRSKLVEWWCRLLQKPLCPIYELVSSSYPGAIHCIVTFRREGSAFKSTVTSDDKNVNENIYVNLT